MRDRGIRALLRRHEIPSAQGENSGRRQRPPLDKDRVLAHVGLATVTYVPFVIDVLFALMVQRNTIAETFGSSVAEFLGYVATSMTMFGWPLLLAALAISLKGLVKRKHLVLNTVSLGCCLAWLASGYWVLTNF